MPIGPSWGLALLLLVGACSSNSPSYDPSLPPSSTLGAPSGYQWIRTVIHTHSPFSYDACDKNPNRVDGYVNTSCLQNFRRAVCQDRLDFVFITDHPKDMEFFPFELLLLIDPQSDVSLRDGSVLYANQMGGCENDHTSILSAGMESNLIAIAMENHWGATPEEREKNYTGQDRSTRDQLRDQTSALVLIPHTEKKSWTVQQITELAPDGIEIYNIHANLDPKIRKVDFNWPPFLNLARILTYLADPLGELKPDFSFLGFLQVHSIYFEKWDFLLGQHWFDSTKPRVFGYGATDSHENIFPQKVSDGFRLDSHSRLSRMMSNHFLIPTLVGQTDRQKFLAVKQAIQEGRGWEVFEGLGSPVGLHFQGEQAGGHSLRMGDHALLSGGSIQLSVALPSLHEQSLPKVLIRSRSQSAWHRKKRALNQVSLRLQLKQITFSAVGKGSSETKVVAEAVNQPLLYSVVDPGVYRVEIWMQPLHLMPYLGVFGIEAEREHLWAVSNPLYIRP